MLCGVDSTLWRTNNHFSTLCDLYGGVEGKGHTRRMRRFEDPVRVFRVGDDLVSPFDLEVAAGLFE